MKFFKSILFASLLVQSVESYAEQNILEDQEVINIENLYKETKVSPVNKEKTNMAVAQDVEVPEEKKQKSDEVRKQIQDLNLKSLTDLNQLAPFSDIMTIQKKYLPKTSRFQFYLAGGVTTNSPWFLSLGAKLNLAYHFNESFALEATGLFLTSSENQVAKEIRDNNNLQPEKFVVMKNNVGVAATWSPIYGKITTTEDEIIPFEMYFSFGGGSTGTSAQEGNVTNFLFSTGQVFALSKSTAFRWDYSWYYYQATPQADASSTNAPQKNNYSDLILTAGISFFFPEVGYR